jgi:hypothetical protein
MNGRQITGQNVDMITSVACKKSSSFFHSESVLVKYRQYAGIFSSASITQ